MRLLMIEDEKELAVALSAALSKQQLFTFDFHVVYLIIKPASAPSLETAVSHDGTFAPLKAG